MPYFRRVRRPPPSASLLFRKNGIFDDKWHEYRFSSRSSLLKNGVVMLEMNQKIQFLLEFIIRQVLSDNQRRRGLRARATGLVSQLTVWTYLRLYGHFYEVLEALLKMDKVHKRQKMPQRENRHLFVLLSLVANQSAFIIVENLF